MKNIYEILKTHGIEIPEDKKDAFEKDLTSNYKTVAEVEKLKEKVSNAEKERDTYKSKYDEDISKRDTDLANLKKQLEDAGGDSAKLVELQSQFETLKTTYSDEKTKLEKQLADQRYEFAVKERVSGLKFTSNSAKKAFISDLLANPLQLKDDVLMGFDDFVNVYKEQDAGAFVVDNADDGGEGEKKPPVFSGKTGKSEKEIPGTKEKEKTIPVIW